MKNKLNKKIVFIVVALILGLGAYLVYGQFFAPKAESGSKEVTIEIFVESENIDKTYTVKTDSEFVYDLLTEEKALVKSEFLDSSFGPMLVGMEGYKASDSKNEYYHILVNGEDAMVGVKELPVKDGDVFRFEVRNF